MFIIFSLMVAVLVTYAFAYAFALCAL